MGEAQIWSASRDASEQQLSGPVCGKLREQLMKLRHRVNVDMLQKEYKFVWIISVKVTFIIVSTVILMLADVRQGL